MKLDLRSIDSKHAYKLLIGSVVPRPIAWVSTINDKGDNNLAPYSFFTVASRNPPMLCISISPGIEEREGTIKDTLSNIRSQKQLVINIVPSLLGNEMQKTAEHVPSKVDEFKAAGLTPAKSTIVNPPRVEEAPISIELELNQILELGSDHLVIANVVHYHIQDEYYLGDYKVDVEKVGFLARLAGDYGEINNIHQLPKL
ncbi:flavin reductase family protein [Virgibacillus litoralis]|uniref:Flavin reductase (DIM6/NTAB) family NADH-FMN oxidoreductase RutF n=1 Tax=Virgibacillus litoralis TaxID=578221 RepID=A0ABS4H8H4_9BACI|nr:flavin reductase family protein [Virgibacillus litoralis]MBP1947158.1 flavin reductase (DIM6/NTAB) family NADH-FMN oxidoreductase RutF [Virgibacillus litoralis]